MSELFPILSYLLYWAIPLIVPLTIYHILSHRRSNMFRMQTIFYITEFSIISP